MEAVTRMTTRHLKPGESLGATFRFGPVHTYVITPEAATAIE